jgi:hypothetical protein
MLPSLAAVFVLGLLCGAQISVFPLSVIVLLAGIAVGFSLLERVGYIDSPSALFLYSSLLLGVVYWSLATPTSEPRPISPPLHETGYASVTGRVIAPVQHSVGRWTLKRDAYALYGATRVSRFIMVTILRFRENYTVQEGP